jgi:molybdopterin converting factor small subunit
MDPLPRTASITVLIPGPLQKTVAGAAKIGVEASSVRALLEALEHVHPDLYKSVCDETGRVRPHVNLFINTDHMRDREGLDTPLRQGDVVYILPAVSGG